MEGGLRTIHRSADRLDEIGGGSSSSRSSANLLTTFVAHTRALSTGPPDGAGTMCGAADSQPNSSFERWNVRAFLSGGLRGQFLGGQIRREVSRAAGRPACKGFSSDRLAVPGERAVADAGGGRGAVGIQTRVNPLVRVQVFVRGERRIGDTRSARRKSASVAGRRTSAPAGPAARRNSSKTIRPGSRPGSEPGPGPGGLRQAASEMAATSAADRVCAIHRKFPPDLSVENGERWPGLASLGKRWPNVVPPGRGERSRLGVW